MNIENLPKVNQINSKIRALNEKLKIVQEMDVLTLSSSVILNKIAVTDEQVIKSAIKLFQDEIESQLKEHAKELEKLGVKTKSKAKLNVNKDNKKNESISADTAGNGDQATA